jgi:hypothetical protein
VLVDDADYGIDHFGLHLLIQIEDYLDTIRVQLVNRNPAGSLGGFSKRYQQLGVLAFRGVSR